MPITYDIKTDYLYKKEHKKGRKKGVKKTQAATVEKMIQAGFPIEQIADLLDLSIEKVEKIKAEL